MTLEQLCGCNATELEALSDAELNAILSPYFNITRPDNNLRGATRIGGVSTSTKHSLESAVHNDKLARSHEILKAHGLGDLASLFSKK